MMCDTLTLLLSIDKFLQALTKYQNPIRLFDLHRGYRSISLEAIATYCFPKSFAAIFKFPALNDNIAGLLRFHSFCHTALSFPHTLDSGNASLVRTSTWFKFLGLKKIYGYPWSSDWKNCRQSDYIGERGTCFYLPSSSLGSPFILEKLEKLPYLVSSSNKITRQRLSKNPCVSLMELWAPFLALLLVTSGIHVATGVHFVEIKSMNSYSCDSSNASRLSFQCQMGVL